MARQQAQCCRQLIVLLAHQQAQCQECLHRRQHDTPVGIALSACKGRRCTAQQSQLQDCAGDRGQQVRGLPACWCLHRGQNVASGGGLQGPACAPDLWPHTVLLHRRLTKTESKKGVSLVEAELARSGSETSDAAAAARSGRDMEDVTGTSCIVGTVRGEDYNFQVRPKCWCAGVLLLFVHWGTLRGRITTFLESHSSTVSHLAGELCTL